MPHVRLSSDPNVMRLFYRTRSPDEGSSEGRWLAERFETTDLGPGRSRRLGPKRFLGFVRRTDLAQVVAYTARQNASSRRVMEKLGMTRDPAEDFPHSAVPSDHPLRMSVLYRRPRHAVEVAA